MFKAHWTSMPANLHSLLNEYIAPWALRSSSTLRLIILTTRTELAKRTWSAATPIVWNSLPDNVVNVNNLYSFKKYLNTYLYYYASLVTVRQVPLNLWH